MTYIAPYIDQSGVHTSTYADIEAYLVGVAVAAGGSDLYLGADTFDFQMIAAFSQLTYDTHLAIQFVYNNRSPVGAIGTSLDGLVALNGLSRYQPTNSLVTLTLSGDPFSVITNGIVTDGNNNAWLLPATVTLDSTGTASATAIAATTGPVTAQANTINKIQNPQAGWVSVTNPNPASVGTSVESDGQLKARQAISTAGPTQAILDGILGAVLNLPQVTAAQLYENDTSAPVTSINGVTNPSGFPANSMTMVVIGGDDQVIANTIANRKTPGAYTNGTTVVNITDISGTVTPIRFYRPINQEIDVTVTVVPIAQNGYNDSIRNMGKQAVVDYINSLPAGQGIVISELWQVVLNSTGSKKPLFSLKSITAGLHMGSQSTNDIPMNFNVKAMTQIADVNWIFPS